MVHLQLLFFLPLAARALVNGPWSDVTMDPSARAAALVANMTMDEKLVCAPNPTMSQKSPRRVDICIKG